MKKIYQQPDTLLVHIETQQMIADSLGVSEEKTVTNESEVLSREMSPYSVWDDEE